jgi:SnoaL-like domain
MTAADHRAEEPVEPPVRGARESSPPALAALIRRYAYAYVCCGDFEVARQIMVKDYQLRMGPHLVDGRDSQYREAVRRQFEEYPGLCLTVHRIVCNGDRLAMLFTEHGWSVRRQREAAWSGIALYRWNGHQLTSCRVEQDYWARTRQLRSGAPNQVQPPGLAPWPDAPAAADQQAAAAVRRWLGGWAQQAAGADLSGGLGTAAVLDDEPSAAPERILLAVERVDVHDAFSAGPTVAFHAGVHGRYAGGLAGAAGPAVAGVPVVAYLAGLAQVRGGQVTSLRAVTDRLGLAKGLARRAAS